MQLQNNMNNANQQTYRVYYEDTDAGGVVYYANYLKFAERARTDWLREKELILSELAEKENLLFVVKKVQMEFHKPARLDDIITVKTTLDKISGTRLYLTQTLCHNETTLVTIQVSVAAVDNNIKPARLPKHLVNKLWK